MKGFWKILLGSLGLEGCKDVLEADGVSEEGRTQDREDMH